MSNSPNLDGRLDLVVREDHAAGTDLLLAQAGLERHPQPIHARVGLGGQFDQDPATRPGRPG